MPGDLLRTRDPRSLLPPVAVLAGVVVLLAGLHAAQGLVATVTFAALAAVICRELQLVLLRRGLRPWLALTLTVIVFVLVIGSLAAAFVASIVALVAEIGGNTGALADQARALATSFGQATGVPVDAVPEVDPGAVLSALRSALAMVSPAVTGLLMAVLIVTYLLLDAGRLRGRMLEAAGPAIVGRYDALAAQLVTYIRVRAILGAAAAVADTILLLVLGVPYAVLWGVVSFLFSFVPNIGFLLALVPPTLLAFMEGGLGPALAVVAGYVAINLAFDYVLQPRVMSVELDISPVVVVTCILVWTMLIGPMGALLAVPLTIAVRAALVPFRGARWFVALLGPVPDDAEPGATPADEPATPAPGGPATTLGA